MKNPEKRHIASVLTFCMVGFMMLTVANPIANPAIFQRKNEALQGITAAFGGIFVWVGLLYASARMFFLSEDGKMSNN